MQSNYHPPVDLHISRLMLQSSNRSHVPELGFQDYSAIGQLAMTPIPRFSNYGCYGELNPQAGYLRPEIGWSQQEHFQYHHPPPHYLDMRVITEREIEEKRIREEIIQLDIARRHALEAEARRVLMMEREFIPQRGSNGFPFSSFRTFLFESLTRLSCSVTRVEERWVLVDMIAKLLEERDRLNGMCETGRLDTLPFQRGTSYLKVSEVKPAVHEDNKEEKIILLPKPYANASGSKREAETLDAFMKKKAKVEWSCAVCEFSAFSERQLNEHLRGTKHKNEECKMRRARKSSKKYRIGLATNCKSAAESLACEKKKRCRARKMCKKQASQSHIVQQNCGAGQSMIRATINSSKSSSGSKNYRIGQVTYGESAAESLACEKKKRRRARKRSQNQATLLHIAQRNCGVDRSMIAATEYLACEKKKRRRARKRTKKQTSQLHIVQQNCGADQSMILATINASKSLSDGEV